MEKFEKYMYVAGRALLGFLFFVSGIGKIDGFSDTVGMVANAGIPASPLLLAIAIAVETIAGLMLMIGARAREAAIAIVLFLVPVTILFHGFWNLNAAAAPDQITHFLKNLAILGGMLIVAQNEHIRMK